MKQNMLYNNSQLGNKQSTYIMGILNVTPDSFSDGGLYTSKEKAIGRALAMIKEGADIIDIGGESTRPGAHHISSKVEIERIASIIEGVRQNIGTDAIISVDTYKSEVAKKALELGADMINSMGGFTFDPQLVSVVKFFHCPILMYHIKGEPATMQEGKLVYKDLMGELYSFFQRQIAWGVTHGLKEEQLMIDPGIGFGKTVAQNIEIIRKLSLLHPLHVPIAIGVSRKSHLGILLQESLSLAYVPEATDRLEGALAETALAVLNGATIVRTHDIIQTKRFLVILDKLKTK